MKTIFLMLLAFSVRAQAHIELGVYQGVDDAGATCSMEVVDQTYIGGMHHPLNERVNVLIGTEKYEVGHPAIIQETPAKVGFNHDKFQTVVATSVGANALVISVSHVPGSEGPTSYTLSVHDWSQAIAKVQVCKDLKHL